MIKHFKSDGSIVFLFLSSMLKSWQVLVFKKLCQTNGESSDPQNIAAGNVIVQLKI